MQFVLQLSLLLLLQKIPHLPMWGSAGWPSGRASSSGVRGRRFETYLRRVVFLSKTFKSPKVLVMLRKRWFCPEMTEILLTWPLSLNKNKQTFPTCTALFNDLYSMFGGNFLAILVSCRVLVSILIVITLFHDRDIREAKIASYINIMKTCPCNLQQFL